MTVWQIRAASLDGNVKKECSPQLFERIRTRIIGGVVGQKAFIGADSPVDMMRRYCPDIADIAAEEQCEIVASNDPELLKDGWNFRFDVIKIVQH